MGRFRHGQEIEHARNLRRIDHRHAIHPGELAGLDGGFGRAPVDDGGVVAIELARVGLEIVVRHLAVVGCPERPAAARTLAGGPEVPVERRRENLPAHRHLAGPGIHADAADHAVELGLVIGGVGVAPLRQRHGEPRRDEDVFTVFGQERRAVVAHRVRDRAEDLMGFEIAQIDAGDAVVGVVVHEEPAAVVETIGLGEPRMVDVPPGVVAEHRLRLLVEAITGSRIRSEDGDRGDVPHRGDARDEHLAGVAAGVEEIKLVLGAGRDPRALGGRGVRLAGRGGRLARGIAAGEAESRREGEDDGDLVTDGFHGRSGWERNGGAAVIRRSGLRASRPGNARGRSRGTGSAPVASAR